MSPEHSKQLRVAIVTGSLSGHAGGGPRSTAIHAKALTENGVIVTIFAGHSRKYPLTPDLFGVDHLDIVASRLWGPSVLGLCVGALFSLFRRAHEFDVIHLNGHWNFTTYIAAIIARVRGIPYVITARGHLGTYDFTHLWFLKLFLYPLMEIPNIRHAALMHVCSDWEQRDSARALSHARRVVKLPNVVDFSDVLPLLNPEDARERLDLPQDAHVYLFLARVAPDKCPDMLIRSWAAADLPPTALLVIAGPATPAYAQSLRDLAANLDVSNRVRFTGYVDRELKRQWLSAANIFVLPSTDDSFSVAVIEAVASGLHCILSPYVGAAEYVPSSMVTSTELNETAWAAALRSVAPRGPTRWKESKEWRDQFCAATIGRQWAQTYQELTR